MNPNSGDSLQTYFEQQNDNEAASIVAAVIALLPSSWEQLEEDDSHTQSVHNNSYSATVLNNNILLTKESEIAALKEVIIKWRSRAIEAEQDYSEQLKIIQLQHEKEFKLMESRYSRKLYEQEDIINSLNEQVDYLLMQQQKYRRQSSGDTDSFVSTIDYDEEEDEYEDEDENDTHSMNSSIYDRDVEQGLVTVQSRPATVHELKSENILDNIQVTMRAIEHELSFHTTDTDSIMSTTVEPTIIRRHRRSPTYNSSNTYFSSATLIDSDSINTKKIKKSSSFFLNRIFKKAFPKLYNKKNNTSMKYNTNSGRKFTLNDSSIHFDDFPRSSTDETLNVYSTTTSQSTTNNKKPIHVLDLYHSNTTTIQV